MTRIFDHALRGRAAGVVLVLALGGCVDPTSPEAATAALDAPARLTNSPGVDVAAGVDYGCLLLANGTVECWGDDFSGQAPPRVTAARGRFTQITAGETHNCGLRNDGVVECWGFNEDGQAPDSVRANTGSFVQISAGGSHTCAVRSIGRIRCWGYNGLGQAPANVIPTSSSFVEVGGGWEHSCGLRADGIIQCWGSNLNGRAPATVVPASGVFTTLSVGPEHSCALRSDGAVQCWGSNFWEAAPGERLAGAGSFTQVSVSEVSSCALRSTGAIECWGNDGGGNAPALAEAGPGLAFVDLSAARYQTCALRSDGLVQCWGDTSGEGVPRYAPSFVHTVLGAPRRIEVVWGDLTTNESAFDVERRTQVPGAEWSAWTALGATSTEDTTFLDTAAVAGRMHQYRVRGCNDMGCAPYTESGIATVPSAAPPPPITALVRAVSRTRIDFTWNERGSDETLIVVQRRLSTNGVWGAWLVVDSAGPDTEIFVDATVTTGALYEYRVRECNTAGCSSFVHSRSIYAETIPNVPGAMTRTRGAGRIDLAWIDNSGNETRFEITRRTLVSGVWGAWSPIAQTDANTTAYSDHTVTAGKRYQYRVRACGIAGCSGWRLGDAITI